LLETSTAKVCKEGRFFYLTDLFAEDVAREVTYCVAIFDDFEFEMELLESVFKIDKSLLYYLPFSKIN
jgi:hypothetical protein